MTPEEEKQYLERGLAYQRLGFMSHLRKAGFTYIDKEASQEAGRPVQRNVAYKDEEIVALHNKYANEWLPSRHRRMEVARDVLVEAAGALTQSKG